MPEYRANPGIGLMTIHLIVELAGSDTAQGLLLDPWRTSVSGAYNVSWVTHTGREQVEWPTSYLPMERPTSG
jgi:hypothetical protein